MPSTAAERKKTVDLCRATISGADCEVSYTSRDTDVELTIYVVAQGLRG